MLARSSLGLLILAAGALSAAVDAADPIEPLAHFQVYTDQIPWAPQEPEHDHIDPYNADVGNPDAPDSRPRWPPHTPPGAPVAKTIYQHLNDTPEFSRIFGLVNLNNATIDLLNGTTNVTFFAPTNSAFPKPRHGRNITHPEFIDDENDVLRIFRPIDPAETPLNDLLELVDAAETGFFDTTDESEKDKKRKIIKRIVGAIVSYHVVTQPLSYSSLVDNTTYPTNFTVGHGFLDGQPLRVRVAREGFSPLLTVNLYSKIRGIGSIATNGFLYPVSLPLLPPPAVFQELFLAQSQFSVTTSTIQRAGLTDTLERVYSPGKKGERGTLSGAGAVTFFAPSSQAFNRLPTKLKFFLFSPFGQRALRKILAYHVVPNVVVHSDYIRNATAEARVQVDPDYSSLPERPALELFYQRDLESIIRMRLAETKGQGPYFSSSASAAAHVGLPVRRRRCQLRQTPVFVERPQACCCNKVVYGTGETRKPVITRSNAAADASPLSPPVAVAVDVNAPAAPAVPIADHPTDRPRPPHRPPPPEVLLNVTLPTLLTNHTIDVVVFKYSHPVPPHHPPRYSTRLVANGHPVSLADVVANNGAIHVVDWLFPPRKGGRRHHGFDGNFVDMSEWDDWEEWLPAWAEEDSED